MKTILILVSVAFLFSCGKSACVECRNLNLGSTKIECFASEKDAIEYKENNGIVFGSEPNNSGKQYICTIR